MDGKEGTLITFTAEKNGEVPQLGHVESLEHLTLVAGSVTVETDGRVGLVGVLIRERKAGTDGDLCTDNTVSAIEALGEHVHRSTLSVSDTFSSAE